MTGADDIKFLYKFIRNIAYLATESFFTEVRVIGGENVPKDGPIIVYVSESRGYFIGEVELTASHIL